MAARSAGSDPLTRVVGLSAFRSRLREQVGVVLSDGRTVRVIKLPNRSHDPDRSLVWHEDVARVLDPNLVVVALLHTHYDAVQDGPEGPSAYDFQNAPDPLTNRREYAVPGIVYSIERGTVIWYDRRGVIKRERVPLRTPRRRSRGLDTAV